MNKAAKVCLGESPYTCESSTLELHPEKNGWPSLMTSHLGARGQHWGYGPPSTYVADSLGL